MIDKMNIKIKIGDFIPLSQSASIRLVKLAINKIMQLKPAINYLLIYCAIRTNKNFYSKV